MRQNEIFLKIVCVIWIYILGEKKRKIFLTMKIAPSTQHMHAHKHKHMRRARDNALQLSVDRTEQQRQEQNNITIGWLSEGIIF